jgi:hypothetical protein
LPLLLALPIQGKSRSANDMGQPHRPAAKGAPRTEPRWFGRETVTEMHP